MQARFCTSCGNALIEGDNFCRKCGTAISRSGSAPAVGGAKAASNHRVPKFEDVKSKLNARSYDKPYQNYHEEAEDETVLLAGPSKSTGGLNTGVKADIELSIEDMLRGCSKVVDFGTGKKYEINIPGGLSPGDTVIVEDTGITDPLTGAPCKIELKAVIG